jgi:hypothetical protein
VNGKSWRHPWQVVRMYYNGALIVCCSHRWQTSAIWCAIARERFDSKTAVTLDYDVRRTPEEAQ